MLVMSATVVALLVGFADERLSAALWNTDRPAFAVLETLTLHASESGEMVTSEPLDLHIERSVDGKGRVDVRGFTAFIDDKGISIVHSANDKSFVRIAHSGNPLAALRATFSSLPSLSVALAFATKPSDVLDGFHASASGLALGLNEDDNDVRLPIIGNAAVGWMTLGELPAMRLEVSGGPWVPPGAVLVWQTVTAPTEFRGTHFDVGERREVDSLARLQSAPVPVPVGVMAPRDPR